MTSQFTVMNNTSIFHNKIYNFILPRLKKVSQCIQCLNLCGYKYKEGYKAKIAYILQLKLHCWPKFSPMIELLLPTTHAQHNACSTHDHYVHG